MGYEQLEALRLEGGRVEAAYGFLEAYAEMCVRQRNDVDADLEQAKSRSAATLQLQQRWNLHMEAASSLVEAGQWAMLIDPARALGLWRRAGRFYRSFEFGFGYYLSVLARSGHAVSHDDDADERVIDELSSRVRQLAFATHVAGDEPRAGIAELPEPLRHPQQQAYLMLAGATIAAADDGRELVDFLNSLAESSPHRSGVTPIGALSTPISTMWDVADRLVRREDDDLDAVVSVIVNLARRYDESMQLAMVNQYLWSNAAAPVDVGNFEIAALTTSAFYAFAPLMSVDRVDSFLRRSIAGATPLARGQIEIALDMARTSYEGN